MKKVAGFLALAMVAFLLVFLINITSGISQEKMLWSSGEISLLAEGFRVKSFGDKTVEEPLFVIKIGDTSSAETEAIFWGRILPGHAQNRTLYTRVQNGQSEDWNAVTYRRPAPSEVKEFLENSLDKKFYSKKIVKKNELPTPINNLELTELSRIGYVVTYLAGGIKIYPSGASFEELRELAEKLSSIDSLVQKKPIPSESSCAQSKLLPSDFEAWTKLEPIRIDYNRDHLADMEITTFLDPGGDEKNTRMVEVHKSIPIEEDFSFLVYVEKVEGQVLSSYWQKKDGQWVSISDEEMDKKWAEYFRFINVPNKKGFGLDT